MKYEYTFIYNVITDKSIHMRKVLFHSPRFQTMAMPMSIVYPPRLNINPSYAEASNLIKTHFSSNWTASVA